MLSIEDWACNGMAKTGFKAEHIPWRYGHSAVPCPLLFDQYLVFAGRVEGFAVDDLAHFLHPGKFGEVIACGHGEHIFLVASQFVRSDGRGADMEFIFLHRIPLFVRKYHNGNILPRVLFGPEWMPDQDERPARHHLISLGAAGGGALPMVRHNRVAVPACRQRNAESIFCVAVFFLRTWAGVPTDHPCSSSLPAPHFNHSKAEGGEPSASKG